MKNIYFTIINVMLLAFATFGQSYLTPSEGFKALDILPTYETFSAFDIHDSLVYANDGDTIRCFNMKTGNETNKYGKPAGYASWPSFVTMSPDGKQIWAGFTNSGNTDDRIYSINIETGEWDLQAHLSGNFDLEFLHDSILVSGLNSSNWNDPTSIFVLDTTGNDNHRKIIEIGGSSAGLATDADGNVYYGTYFFSTTNAIYRWNSEEVENILNNTVVDTLTLDNATKLSDLPNGAYDCEVDAGGNLIFNSNSFSSDKVLARWNETVGDGYNFDTLGIATDDMDWFTMIKSNGDVMNHEDENEIMVLSWGRPLAKVYRSKPPVVSKPIGTISGAETDADVSIDLSKHFTDPDDTGDFTYEITVNSDSSVAIVSINGKNMLVDFISSGQTNITLKANSNGQSVITNFIVGVRPEISGNYEISDFENLTLGKDSYWNGSDGTGGFDSHLAHFPNDYNDASESWSGWAYSNMANDSTPGYTNQYSAITAAGVDTLQSGGKNYGVSFVPTNWMTYETLPVSLNFIENSKHEVKGFYVTNSTYASLSMEQGDAFAKKFGGIDGNDPDWFKLSVWGLKNGIETDTVEFFLADYRFDDNTKDYIIKSWQWVELSTLGKIDSLMFTLSSSDVGMWGMNTPAYFCVDNINILQDDAPVVINPIADIIENPDSYDKEINLSNVFTDSDDEDSSIQKSIASNSNTDVVSASVDGDILTISCISEGTSTLVIEGLSNGKSAYDTIHITVNNDQHPFVANPITDLTISEDAPTSEISLENVFSDDDNDDALITKSIVSTVDVNLMSLNIENNILYISLKANQYGESEVVIEANSNGLTVTDTFNIIVNQVNDKPELIGTIEDITVDKNANDKQIDLSNLFTDIDNDELVLSVSENSNESLVSTQISENILTLSFLDNQYGDATITIMANDGIEYVSTSFNVTVNNTTGFSNKDELNINIYPNPTKDYIIIKSPFAIKRIVLMNNYGIIQQVQKPGNGNTEFKLNLISLPAGIYFINIEGNNSQFTKSIIKQ